MNSVEASTHQDGGALLAVQRYRENDFEPYVFRTTDLGGDVDAPRRRRWDTRCSPGARRPGGSPEREHPLSRHRIRALPESGRGRPLRPFRGSAGDPITDLQVAGDELLVATQGRSFWVLDDLTPVRALADRAWDAPALLPAGTAVRLATGGSRPSAVRGLPRTARRGRSFTISCPTILKRATNSASRSGTRAARWSGSWCGSRRRVSSQKSQRASVRLPTPCWKARPGFTGSPGI